MATVDYIFRNGIIMQKLDQAIPGAYLYVFLLSILIFIIFISRVRRIEESPREVFGYFLLLGFLSLLLTGNMSTLLAILLVVTLIWFGARHAWARLELVPAGARTLERRYFPEEERRREDIEAAEKSIERKLKGTKEGAFVREERELETIEEYEDVLVAAEDDISAKIQQAVSSELSSEEKEHAMLQALVGYGQQIERQLQTMGSMDVIDQAGRRYVLGLMQNMVQICQQISANERDANQRRLAFVAGVAEDVDLMKDVTKRSEMMSKGAVQIDKNLQKGLGRSTIAKIVSALRIKKAKLRTLQSAAAAARTSKNEALAESLDREIAELKAEIERIEQTLVQCKGMLQQINAAIVDVGGVLNQIKKLLDVLVGAEKPAVTHEKQILRFQSQFPEHIKKLETSVASFANSVSGLSKEEGIAEDAPVKATIGVGGMFTEVLSLQEIALQQHVDGTKPFVDDMIQVLQDTSPLAPLMNGLHSGFQRMSQAFGSLQAAAATVIAAPAASDMHNLEALESGIEQVALKDESMRASLSNQALSNLQTTRLSVEKIINVLAQEKADTIIDEKQLLAELNRALTAIVTNKARVNAEFQRQADKFTSQIASAQEKLQEARKAA